MLIGESSAGPSNTRNSGKGNKFTINTWNSIHNILNENIILRKHNSFPAVQMIQNSEQQLLHAAPPNTGLRS
jgi:hypothetical protein